MPNEPGGRADKQGNRYEIKWCVYQLLKVIEERIEYIEVESIGDDEVGVDLWVGKKDGSREGQQCKNRNGANETWTYGALNSKEILKKWKDQLDRSDDVSVSLVSPLAFSWLEDLVRRAKNSSEDPNAFFEYQIKGSDKGFVKFATQFSNALGFDIDDSEQVLKLINYLKRINYRQYPDSEMKEIIRDKIGNLFYIEDEELIYDALVSYIVDGDVLAKKINSNEIRTYLGLREIRLKDIARDSKLIPKLRELNLEYKANFQPHQELFRGVRWMIASGI